MGRPTTQASSIKDTLVLDNHYKPTNAVRQWAVFTDREIQGRLQRKFEQRPNECETTLHWTPFLHQISNDKWILQEC
eukprot:4239893-Amphidinium_carterae.1